ncbi:MAG TPA: hypothetical protein VGI19_05815 [Candidatus Cybelea sp.]
MRQHRIIVEGDLDGTSRTMLADTLGLSTRHYTRLQHGIRRRIAVLLSSEMRQRENALGRASPSIRMLPPLHQISVLVATGSTNAAAEQLHTITRQSGDDRLVASALCLQALLRHRYAGNTVGASEALAASRSVMERLAVHDPSRALIGAEIALAAVEIDVSIGSLHRATETATGVAHALESTDETARWLKLRAFSWAAYGEFVLGRRDEALRFLRAVLSDAGETKAASAPERIELSLNTAIVLAELGRFYESSRVLVEAWIVARQNHLNLDVLRLDLMDAMLALDCGDVSTAVRRLSGICEESSRLASPILSAQAHAYLARAQMRSSQARPDEILENARRVLDLTPHEYAAWTDAKIAESFARLMLRDVVGAECAARAADDAAVTMGHRLYRGSTLRELARVAHVQGRKRDAKRMIIGAVEASYGVGKPQQAADALELAAKILQQPSYGQEATVLRRALSLSGAVTSFGITPAGAGAH